MPVHTFPFGFVFADVENAQRLSADRKPKRIEIYAVLNKNALLVV